MLFMTYRPGRASHLASQVRLFPPGPSWVWERAGEAPGRDVAGARGQSLWRASVDPDPQGADPLFTDSPPCG